MVSRETPAHRASRLLSALMERHGYKNANQLEATMTRRGIEPLISAVTIRRILQAKARTEPEKDTLRRLAEFCGETYSQAFPEPEDEAAPAVDFEGVRIALKTVDGRPVNHATAERIRSLLSGGAMQRAEETHKAKAEHRKRRGH